MKMKRQITQKAIKENYETIISVPYCQLQFLLQHHYPVYYTTGVYGWNADIYSINGVAIVTGYRPFGTIKPAAETLRKYNDVAVQYLSDNYKLTYDEQTAELGKLINKFIAEVTA